MTAREHFVVRGLVQGVGFRWFVRETAERLALSGWVRNAADGSVEAEAEGPARSLEEFAAALRQGPASARVDAVDVRRLPVKRDREDFEITR